MLNILLLNRNYSKKELKFIHRSRRSFALVTAFTVRGGFKGDLPIYISFFLVTPFCKVSIEEEIGDWNVNMF